MERTAEITTLLTAWQAGDRRALEQLSPFIYEELRRLARGYFRGERPDHTLQATALVHEASCASQTRTSHSPAARTSSPSPPG